MDANGIRAGREMIGPVTNSPRPTMHAAWSGSCTPFRSCRWRVRCPTFSALCAPPPAN